MQRAMREQKIELREIESDYTTASEFDNNSATGSSGKPQGSQNKSWPLSLDLQPHHAETANTDKECNAISSQSTPHGRRDAFTGKHKRSSTV